MSVLGSVYIPNIFTGSSFVHFNVTQDHLSCFAPGLIALGLMEVPQDDLLMKDRNTTCC